MRRRGIKIPAKAFPELVEERESSSGRSICQRFSSPFPLPAANSTSFTSFVIKNTHQPVNRGKEKERETHEKSLIRTPIGKGLKDCPSYNQPKHTKGKCHENQDEQCYLPAFQENRLRPGNVLAPDHSYRWRSKG